MAEFDVAIIGGGPGGYVAAIRAAQLSMKAVLIEQDRVGGLCLNWGCIPSKALLWSAELIHLLREAPDFGIGCDGVQPEMPKVIDRSRQVVERMVNGVESLLQGNGVTVVSGRGRLQGQHEVVLQPGGDIIQAEHIVIATGARPRSLPGVTVDGQTIITSREALELRDPPRSMVIVGGGPVGVEFAYFYRAFGTEVTVLEMLDHLLPQEDEEIARQLERALQKQGISYRTGAQVSRIVVVDGQPQVDVNVNGQEERVSGEKVLMAVGMAANTEGLGAAEVGVALENGFVSIDEEMRTSVPNIFAVGDCTGQLMLAHVASAQGVFVVERLAGLEPPSISYEKMPRCTYCQPQVASFGLTEAQARERGIDVRIGSFPYRANGKAMATGRTEGRVKLVTEAGTGAVLGYHIVGHDATELLAVASVASLLEVTPQELGWAVYAHPTLSEALKEAALAVGGEAIHFLGRG